jgi:hypothetical protein
VKKLSLAKFLIAANLLALCVLVGPQDAEARRGFWCDPSEGSEWCRCVEEGEWLPGGCWEFPYQIESNCINNGHCGDN